MGSVAKIPVQKGKPLKPVTEADDQELTRWLAWFDGEGKKPDKWASTAAAARAELEARRKPQPPQAEPKPAAKPAEAKPAAGKRQAPAAARPAPAAAPSPAALAKVTPAALALAHDADAINTRFAELRQNYHLVSPATHVDTLPEGFGVSVAFVVANADASKTGPGDVYQVGSGQNAKVGLSGHVIQQIGAAAAIDWDARLSGRLDNGSDPSYVHYRAVGWAKNYDGTPRQIVGEVELDAREGGPLEEEIRQKARKRAERYPNDYNDGGDSQLLELRKFILRHAETKAQNRAICKGLGVKRAYHAAELKKPFAVARLSFTGYSDDPVMRREFSRMNAAAALQGTRALYGEPPAQLPAAPTPAAGHPPPPLGEVPNPDLAEVLDGEFEDAEPGQDDVDPDPGNDQAQADERMRQPGED
jgi:hypothetical protein